MYEILYQFTYSHRYSVCCPPFTQNSIEGFLLKFYFDVILVLLAKMGPLSVMSLEKSYRGNVNCEVCSCVHVEGKQCAKCTL